MSSSATDKEIVLHVGLPKTASTFLQKRVFPQLDKSLVCYNPERVMEQLVKSKKHSYDAESLQALRECLVEELKSISQPKVLISYEQMCGNPWNSFSRFREMTDFMHSLFPNAKIILVLRAQDDWLHSLYRETVAMLNPIWPRQFFGPRNHRSRAIARRFPDLDIWSYDFADMHAHYIRCFGPDRVTVVFFEELKQDPARFVYRVLQALGLEPSEEFRRTVERRGLSAFSILLLLLVLNSPSYVAERLLRPYAYGAQRFAALVRTRSPILVVLCALQRGCQKLNAFLAMPQRLKRFPDRILYLDWNLMGARRRAELMRHYEASNRSLAPHMPNETIRSRYLGL